MIKNKKKTFVVHQLTKYLSTSPFLLDFQMNPALYKIFNMKIAQTPPSIHHPLKSSKRVKHTNHIKRLSPSHTNTHIHKNHKHYSHKNQIMFTFIPANAQQIPANIGPIVRVNQPHVNLRR